jgi:four helix bundle protein
MSNIAEGFESASDKKFANYVNIAKASAGECRSQVYVSIDQGYISQQKGNELLNRLISISRQLSKLETYLRNGSSDGTNEPETKYDF